MIFLVSKNTPWSKSLHTRLSKVMECEWYTEGSYRSAANKKKPSWIFFFHWSHIVPENIYNSHRCVVLHTGNLPKGRGGSPLQNQIIEGIVESRVSAIVMEAEVDSGAVYASLPLTLQGSIDDIWMTAADRGFLLIKECVEVSPTPTPQRGTPGIYKRNKDNRLPLYESENLIEIHKFIQMLDGDSYPNAFLDIGNFRLRFSRSKRRDEEILSDVTIRRIINE